jgi:phosphoribosyl 1,2-cyclic phosphodiesterase
VLAFEGMRKSLEATLSSQMESPYFPVSMQQMPGNITIEELKDKAFQIGEIKVEATFTNHPGICAAFRLTTAAGVIVYCPDNELMQRMRRARAETDEDRKEAEEFGKERDQRLVDFCRNADVLIMDSQYDAEEYPRYVGWGHSCVDDSVALAAEAGVKHFFLFHHDPTHNDAKIDAMTDKARALAKGLSPSMKVDGAREGLEIVLSPKRK